LKRLLVSTYFCPGIKHKPGGVQHVVGPLLQKLTIQYNWTVHIAHTGICCAPHSHTVLPNSFMTAQSDVDVPTILEASLQFSALQLQYDIVLSIDRQLPSHPRIPAILMSNTASYQTEFTALSSGYWNSIIVPTEHFKRQVCLVVSNTSVFVIPYGIEPSVIDSMMALPRKPPNSRPAVIWLPHRPDRRKGHATAIEGLARSATKKEDIRLEISWLDEERYKSYRSELLEFAHQRGVADQVFFTRWFNDKDRLQQLERTDAILQVGNFEETFGLSIVEGVLSKRIVITGRQPAVRETISYSPLWIEINEPTDWYKHFAQANSAQPALPQWNDRQKPITNDLLSLNAMASRYNSILSAFM
jgi:glycosyltransferase involved in cell wall biosynthesis